MNEQRPAERSAPYNEVLAYELQRVHARRLAVHGPTSPGPPPVAPEDHLSKVEEPRRQALEMDLVGLALSGGGIRSATFNLGVLQALASLKLLTRFDYLSTVSGGGYIGGWLAAWVRRESALSCPHRQAQAIENVERQLSPSRFQQASAARAEVVNGQRASLPLGAVRDEEPQPIHHLRAYSRYLAPVAGLLSTDF